MICRLAKLIWLLAVALAIGRADARSARAEEPASDLPIPADPLEPLVPRQARSEVEEDRVAAAALFAHARLLQDRGNLAQALTRYQRAWRHDPAQVAILREIAPLAYELKRNDEAGRYAVLAAELDPQDPVLLRRLAQYLTEQRDWKRAITLYEKSLALDRPAAGPLELTSVTIYFELGRLCFLTDDFARSAAAFAKVREALADPNSRLSAESKEVILGKPSQTYNLWAEAFLAAGRHEEAAALFLQSNEAAEDAANLAFNLARVAFARKDDPAALARLEEYFAAQSTTGGTEPFELLGKIHARQKADAKAARLMTIERLESLAKDQPNNSSVILVLAGEYLAAERLDDAALQYTAVLARRASGEAYRSLVEIYRKQGKLSELVGVAGQVVAQTGSLEVLGAAGKSLTGDVPLVTRIIDQTRARLQQKPEALSPDELQAVALLAAGSKQYEPASEFLEAAIKLDKSRVGKLLLAWGLELLQAEEHERAAGIFRRMLDEQALPTGEASVQFYLAACLEMIGQTDAALAAAERAAALDGDNSRLAGRPAWVLYHAQRYDAARQAQLAILKRHDSRQGAADRGAARQARLALSNIELERGDFSAAVEWLEQVLDEFPEDAGANNDLGYMWVERGLHLNRALAMIRRAVAAEPENKAYRDSLGWALFQLGRYAEAEKELAQAAVDEVADGVILEHWGDALAKLKRQDEARTAWRRAEKAFQTAGESGKLQAVRTKLKQ